jgi:segregation and condensation protein B
MNKNDEFFENQRRVESILFAAKEPVPQSRLENALIGDYEFIDVLNKLKEFYSNYIEIIENNGFYNFHVNLDFTIQDEKPDNKIKKIEGSSLIVLSVIALHQPITFNEVNEILPEPVTKKVFDRLLKLDLIEKNARKLSTGRAITYVTTEEFLNAFNINSIEEIPTPEEVEISFKEVNAPIPTSLNSE